MKKSKLSIGLVTSFIAAMALSACGSKVTKNDSNVASFKYGDKELAVLTDEIYDDFLNSATGRQKYYDRVMEVLIRNAFQKDPTGSDTLKGVKKNYNQIVNEAKDNVKGSKQTAKQNAETNGTSYKTEWQAVLKEKGVKDEEELLQKYIYDLEKEQIEDWYYDEHEEELKSEYLGVTKDGKEVKTEASSRFPYHVRHILVKVEDGGSDYVRGTISSAQAKLLSNTVELLAQGYMEFGEVAQKKSEDSSANSYGDVGIMANAISGGKLGMVNEFQLGIYAYDAIKKNAETSKDVIDKGLALDQTLLGADTEETTDDKTVKEAFANRGIVEIPYSAFIELGDVAELEANWETGIPMPDNKAAVYPRNLLWNTYFNTHNIFVITNGKRNASAETIADTDPADIDRTSATGYYGEGEDDYRKYDANPQAAAPINYKKLSGFKAGVPGFGGANERVLCDKQNNVIIGVRSQFGIHLMIVEKSAYDFADEVSLNDYYTTAIPGESDYPTYKEGEKKGQDMETYVNFINSVNKSEYNTRAEAVRSAIKGFDSTYDYRLYAELTKNREKDFSKSTNDLLSAIDDYIDVQRDKNNHDQEKGMFEVWKTYYELLLTQDSYRKATEKNRILPEGCKIGFTKDGVDKSNYEQGGKCYVK